MKLKFNQEEETALRDLGIEVKKDYTDEDLVKMEEVVGNELGLHFDENDNPFPKAFIYESILDKISEVE